MKHWFTEHPATVGETYWQHLQSALCFSFHMALGCAACLVHAFFPFLFERTGSARIALLHDRMIVNRSRLNRIPSAEPTADSRPEIAELFSRQPDVKA